MKTRLAFIAFLWLLGTSIANSQCHAFFTQNYSAGGQFIDSSYCAAGDSIISAQWNFGDGTTVTYPGQNGVINHVVNHNYNHSGLYNVCCTITTLYGCSDTFCDSTWINVTVDSASCNNLAVTLTQINSILTHIGSQVSGGTPPYSYLWSDGSTDAYNGDVGEGLYCVTVTDSIGCTATSCIEITNCYNLSASFNYNINPNSGPYTVSFYTSSNNVINQTWHWEFGDGTATNVHNPMHIFPGPGVYHVCLTVNSSNGCTKNSCLTIVLQSPVNCNNFQVLLNAYNDSINNSHTVISSNIWNGQTPFTYHWSNGNSASTINVWDYSGQYCLTVTDYYGCVATSCANINCDNFTANIFESYYHDSLYLNHTSLYNPCSYQWSNGSTEFGIPIESNITHYCVTVTSPIGCAATACFQITNDSLICQGFDVFTNFSNNGAQQISSNVTGGSAPYSYLWSTGENTPNITLTSNNHLYCVTVTDNNGCTTSDCINTFDSTNCNGITAVIIDSLINGNHSLFALLEGSASNNYTYLWNTGATSSAIHNAYVNHTYCVTVTDELGCSANDCFFLTQDSITNCDFSISPITIQCGQDTSTTIFLQFYGNAGPCTYLWSNGATTSSISVDLPGNYCVTVTNSLGCEKITCLTIMAPTNCSGFYITTIVDDSLSNNISSNTFGGIAPFSYLWSNSATTSSISNLSEGNYCLTVTDANGCQSSSCEYITNSDPADTLTTNPFDTCIYVVNSYIDTVNVIDSSSVVVTWTLVDSSGTIIYYSTTYTYATPGNVVVNLEINCAGNKGIIVLSNIININQQLISKSIESFIDRTEITLYPNPISDKLCVDINSKEDSSVNIIIYNSIGEILYQQQQIINNGKNSLLLNTTEFSSGLYFLKIKHNTSKVETRKFMK